MAKKELIQTAPTDVLERNLTLTGEVMRFLLEQPEVFNSLPANFELVILPEDDPEMGLYNLKLLNTYGSEGKPVVFARIKSSREAFTKQDPPRLYAPIAA